MPAFSARATLPAAEALLRSAQEFLDAAAAAEAAATAEQAAELTRRGPSPPRGPQSPLPLPLPRLRCKCLRVLRSMRTSGTVCDPRSPLLQVHGCRR